MKMGNEDRYHSCTSSTRYKYARKRHGYIALYNAKMQNVKSLLPVFNLVLFLKTSLQSRPFHTLTLTESCVSTQDELTFVT